MRRAQKICQLALWFTGLPCWLRWWRICLQCRRPRFDPWARKIPWWTEWLATLVLLPEESHAQRSLVGSTGLHRVGQDWVTNTSPFTPNLPHHKNFQKCGMKCRLQSPRPRAIQTLQGGTHTCFTCIPNDSHNKVSLVDPDLTLHSSRSLGGWALDQKPACDWGGLRVSLICVPFTHLGGTGERISQHEQKWGVPLE